MIHIIEMPIAAKTDFGKTYSKDVALPSKIHRIRGVLANALLGPNTYFEKLLKISKGHCDALNAISVQVATFSLSLNNSTIVAANAPVCAVNELRKNGYKHNLTPVDGIIVPSGTFARIVVEEKNKSPFMSRDKFSREYLGGNYASIPMSEIKKCYFGEEVIPASLSNDYKVKIYIDYD